MTDIFGAMQSGWNMGQQMGEQKRQRTLADLLGKAAQAPQQERQGFLSQAYGVDPGAAMQAEQAFGQQEDQRAERLRERARMLVSLPPQMRPQAYASLIPELQQMGLGEGIPPQWTDDLLPTVEAIATSGQQQNVPAGFDAAHRTLIAAGYQPGSPEYQQGMQIEAGLIPGYGKSAPRSMTVDINGRPVEAIFDPMARTHTPAQLGGGAPAPMQGGDPFGFLAQAGAQVTSGYRSKADNVRVDGVPNSYHLSGQARDILPPTDPQQAAFIRQQAQANGLEVIDEGDHWHLEPAPRGRQGAGVPIVGRRKEDEAAAVQAAKNAVDLSFLPAEMQIKVQAAIEQAGGKAQAAADVKRGEGQRDKDRAYAQFEQAMRGVESALAGTVTNPAAGFMPALTSDQQTAEGSVAAMAPILKQLFRASGEGVFTDKDQEMLMKMMPTRSDHPEARAAKIANIRAIVAAKLGSMGGTSVERDSGEQFNGFRVLD